MKEYKVKKNSNGHALTSEIDPDLLEILSRMTASKPEDRITSDKLVESLEIFKRRKLKTNKRDETRNLSNSFYQAFVKTVGQEKKSFTKIKSFYFKKLGFSICLPCGKIKERKYLYAKNKNEQVKAFEQHDTLYDPKKVNLMTKRQSAPSRRKK